MRLIKDKKGRTKFRLKKGEKIVISILQGQKKKESLALITYNEETERLDIKGTCRIIGKIEA